MQIKRWTKLRDGVVGEFVPVVDPPRTWAPGMVRLGDDGAEAVLVDAELLGDDHLPLTALAIAGRTEIGDLLLMSVRSRSGSLSGFPAQRYRSHALILDVDFDDVDEDKVSGVQLAYHGLLRWSGDRHLVEEPIVEGGEVSGWVVRVSAQKPRSAELDPGFTLEIRSGWSVDGPFDRRMVDTPMLVRVSSQDRHSLDEHLLRLDAVHALLSLSHKEQVHATRGSARLLPDRSWTEMWEYSLLDHSADGRRMQEFPYLDLDVIGGVSGVAAWVRLGMAHRRAVEPLVRHTLFDNQTPEARLFSTAAAMEYWVATNRRTAKWAQKRTGEHLPGALASVVSPDWQTWIGHSDSWVKRFWDVCGALKHDPSAAFDPSEVHALEVSGRWLLSAVLLDHCAGNSEPSKHLFSKSLSLLGSQLREVLRLDQWV